MPEHDHNDSNDQYALTQKDIVAVGGDLEPESLIKAYANGLFPMPFPYYTIAWFCPLTRGILEIKNLHISRTLRRIIKKKEYHYTIDKDFEKVIKHCSQVPRPHQEGSDGWLTDEMIDAYINLHRLGHAHSVEIRDKTGDLIGGVYGIDTGGFFSAESMFYLKPNASKLAIIHLAEHLSERGLDWIDIQMFTPHMGVMGARPMARKEFLEKIDGIKDHNLTLFAFNL
ncbi:leucyl/phenylalanyl-tRNA--protein transferase [Spirochaetota bacterium]